MDELNHKNGKNDENNDNNGNYVNGNGSLNGNGKGKIGRYDLESKIENDGWKSKAEEFIVSVNRKLVPCTNRKMLHLEKENKNLKRTLLHVDERDITPRDMGVESQYDVYLQKIMRTKASATKFIRLKKDKNVNSANKYEIIAVKEMDREKGLSSKLDKYTKYIDLNSKVLSSIVAIYGKPFEITVKDNETILSEFDFSEGEIKKIKSNIHCKTEAGIINSYANDINKKDYRKYETPVFDDEKNLMGILTVKESPIKMSKEDWDFMILMIENDKERFVNSIKKAEHYEETLKHATRDSLTGLHNRRYSEQKMIKYLEIVMTLFKDKLIDGFLMFDIDNFKDFNEKYGHLVGDRVLTEVGHILEKVPYHETDTVSRLGGEEFGMYLQGITPEQMMMVAERARSSVANYLFKVSENKIVPLTICGGGTTTWIGMDYMKIITNDPEAKNMDSELYEQCWKFRESHEAYKSMLKNKDMDDAMRDRIKNNFYAPTNLMRLGKVLYKTADLPLHRAKKSGKNKVCLFDFELDYHSQNLHAIENIEETESKE